MLTESMLSYKERASASEGGVMVGEMISPSGDMAR
jgi:hypothetical protein